eukprot:TRINITY_DN10539_c0_g1_i2.p1 TRINITY_DN10539_c0_g1~~TRINITY_DN10539_c0_g1_i2.p1  ORF type:complete len:210 (-),score=5.80 TRINITY_DN10539_c0_g1_i2:107-712(-)
MKHCERCGTLANPNSGPKLLVCSRCRIAHYCSKKCQSEDWTTHKQNCKEAEPKKEAPSGEKLKCGLCGNRNGPFTRTRCCNHVVCDDEGDYQLMSFARNSCHRNHSNYTVCAFHYDSGHKGDWKTCKDCQESIGMYEFVEMGTNPKDMPGRYNFLDNVLENPPKAEAPKCGVCGKDILTRHGGYSMRITKKGSEMVHMQCS